MRTLSLFGAAAQLEPTGYLVVEVSRSHSVGHSHQVGLACTSVQLVIEAATYTQHTTNTRY